MIALTIRTREGLVRQIEGEAGFTLMEAIRRAGIYELVAMCGGSCSCATCHVYVESGPGEARRPASEDEDDLLDSSDHRRENSRLSCQIEITEALAGLVVQIAPQN